MLALATGVVGGCIFLFRESAATYFYYHPQGRHEYPIGDYLLVFDRSARVMVKIALLLAVAAATNLVSRVFSFTTKLWGTATPVRVAVVLALMVLAGYLVALSTTPQINFGPGKEGLGYGHDGVDYGKIADDFRPFETTVERPFAFRILPSLFVFYLGIGTFRGFHLVNAICYGLSCLVVYRLLRWYKVKYFSAVLGVGLFICLKFGLKFWLYYPVLTDGLGTLLLTGVLLCAVSGRHILYLTCMMLAVFCRENLLGLVPFHILCLFSGSRPRREAFGLALLNLVPLAAFVLSRSFPFVIPVGGYSLYRQALSFATLLALDPKRQVNFFLAHINSLGVLAVVPFLFWKRSLTFFLRHRCWCYFFFMNLVLSIIGGNDRDRFALWQAPMLVILVAGELSCQARQVLFAHLLFLQAVWSELFMPWRPDVDFYLSRYAVYPPTRIDSFFMELSCAVVTLIVAFLYAYYKGSNASEHRCIRKQLTQPCAALSSLAPKGPDVGPT